MIETALGLAGALAFVVVLATAFWHLANLPPVPDRLIDEAIDRAGVIRDPAIPRPERRRLSVMGAEAWLIANSIEAATMEPVQLRLLVERRLDARPHLLEP